MTATIISFPHRGPAVRCVDPLDEALSALRLAALKAEKSAEEVERLERLIEAVLVRFPGRPIQ